MLVCAMLQARESLLEEWEKAAVIELHADRATLLMKRTVRYFLDFSMVFISSFSRLFSHRCSAASLLCALLLEAVHATVLVQGTPFYGRACKGMGLGGGRAVQIRLSERGAVRL